MSDSYRVQLDIFTGPLDLLLYLIRRDEVDIYDIPIARITEQYIQHVQLLEQLDPDAIGDFLVLAATLIELKSRALLPTPPLDGGDEPDDPRAPLVRQLLEYKRFKDAARTLGHAADDRAKRYVRMPAELPKELAGLELEEANVWDLLTAFGRVMSAIGRGPGQQEIRYDDTPIELHAAEILAILEQESPTTFQALFSATAERIEIVGRFLALLELIHRKRIRAEQERTFGTIYIFLLIEVDEPSRAVSARSNDEPSRAVSARSNDEPSRAVSARSDDEQSRAVSARSDDEPSRAVSARSNDEQSRAVSARSDDEQSRAVSARSDEAEELPASPPTAELEHDDLTIKPPKPEVHVADSADLTTPAESAPPPLDEITTENPNVQPQ